MYGVDLPSSAPVLSEIEFIPGRMEFIQREPFEVVVDYAHTPDSLREVYKTLKPSKEGKLICILGAAGGGRDKWKRPEFGKIADQYCDHIFLTDEDPYDEDPSKIIEDIKKGIAGKNKLEVVMDRKEAMKRAVNLAGPGDVVVITGKGSEATMALKGGKKVEWSDRKYMEEAIKSK